MEGCQPGKQHKDIPNITYRSTNARFSHEDSLAAANKNVRALRDDEIIEVILMVIVLLLNLRPSLPTIMKGFESIMLSHNANKV